MRSFYSLFRIKSTELSASGAVAGSLIAFQQSEFCQAIQCKEVGRWPLATGGVYHDYHTAFGGDYQLILGVTTESGKPVSGIEITQNLSSNDKVMSVELLLSDKSASLSNDGSIEQLVRWLNSSEVPASTLKAYLQQQLQKTSARFPDDVEKLIVGNVEIRAAIVKTRAGDRGAVRLDVRT